MKPAKRAPRAASPPRSLFLDDSSLALATDLYQLTMAAGYFQERRHLSATFELFVRDMPEGRSFLVAAGLEQVVHYLLNLRFSASELDFLSRHPVFRQVPRNFFDYLATLRFTGDLWAMAEGTVFFAAEPILRVTAPIIEAQLIETFLLGSINFQVSVASKAARLVLAAGERPVIEFGTRRAHGPQAGVLAGRAAYLGGCAGTSNVAAGRLARVPIFGTMAHSFVLAFDREEEAFAAYRRLFPQSAVLLVDTYDTLRAVRRAVDAGVDFQGIRLDSGNLAALSRRCRRILDQAGLRRARILASGDLDEYRIRALVRDKASIDSFGVGSSLATSSDQPVLGGVYKLVALNERKRVVPRMKISAGKATLPGVKQVYRRRGARGAFVSDRICLHTEQGPAGAEPLLLPVLRGGRMLSPLPDLEAARARTQDQVRRLPAALRDLDCERPYPVRLSSRLVRLRDRLEGQVSS